MYILYSKYILAGLLEILIYLILSTANKKHVLIID